MICENCKKEIPKGSEYCPYCEEEIIGNATPAEQFYWSFCDHEDVVIEKYLGNDENVVIPKEIDGHIVVEIDEAAFWKCRTIKSIRIPNSVDKIGDSAFYGCSSLETIKLPEFVVKLGERAFYDCSSLKSVKIPTGIEWLSRGVFAYCSSLKSVEIPDKVEVIRDYAFLGCTSLTSIDIPEGTIVADDAFRDTPLEK